MVNEHCSVISQDSLDIGVTICIALCFELVKLGLYRAIVDTSSWAVTVESPSPPCRPQSQGVVQGHHPCDYEPEQVIHPVTFAGQLHGNRTVRALRWLHICHSRPAHGHTDTEQYDLP